MNNTTPLSGQAETYYSKAINYLESSAGFIKKYNADNYEQAMELCKMALKLWLEALGEEDTSEDDGGEFDFGESFVEGIIPHMH